MNEMTKISFDGQEVGTLQGPVKFLFHTRLTPGVQEIARCRSQLFSGRIVCKIDPMLSATWKSVPEVFPMSLRNTCRHGRIRDGRVIWG